MKIEPKLRNNFETELYQIYRNVLLSTIRNTAKFAYPFKSCINCNHFNDKKEICLLANSRPPAPIIVYGCDSHIEKNDIPF